MGGTTPMTRAELDETLARLKAMRENAKGLAACEECDGVGPGEPCSKPVRLALTRKPVNDLDAWVMANFRDARVLLRENHASRTRLGASR
jgi:hypothetical protein